MVPAVENFHIFLLGCEFLLRTDHAALRNLLGRDLPPTSLVERWILRLTEYNFKIECKKCEDNVIADMLSRLHFAVAQTSCKWGDHDRRSLDSISSMADPVEAPNLYCKAPQSTDAIQYESTPVLSA